MGQYLSKKNHASYKVGNSRKRPCPSDSNKGSPLRKRLHSTYDYVYKELFVQGKGSDICILALKRTWNLHKLYIKQSPFFCAMLEGGWKENDSTKLELEITDPNVTQESLNNVFGSFYCDYITINEETVISTIAAATWFHMEDIRILCTEFMYSKVNLTNVIKYFNIAEEYNLPELIDVCVLWLARNLLILEDNLATFDLIKSIPINLMNRVINCPTMVDIFLLLLKWLFLKINPNIQYECKRKLIKDAYKYLTTDNPGFLESPAGEAYAPTFAAVRWEHVITIFKTTDRKLKNLVIPKDWLSQAFCRQWMRLLFIHESQTGASRATNNNDANTTENSFIEGNNSNSTNETSTTPYSSVCTVPGPSQNLPAEYFWRYSERCGRKMQSDTNTCSWRWTGFHFGLDLIIKYRRRAFSVVRFWDQNLVDGAITHTETHNLQIAMKVKKTVKNNQIYEMA
ncbi:Germ cell-less protein-like 1 [Cichlidogyrus casuarinus]|uniref:Germ cell-less protein-like 1 n=1 Tax=Cichlidogyrus casuarinus TaxID=1844966 RepID=A0ABD2QD48_9PLAT